MKHFIVSKSLEEYEAYATKHKLNSRDVFYCISLQKAEEDMKINIKQGIDAQVIVL